MITRFAPSPTGYLHLGHALAADQAFGFANRQGRECLLRVEDIDHTRCRPEYTDAIFEDLNWLGFDWPKPARVQSQHKAEYAKALEALRSRDLIYPCYLTRKEIATAEAQIGAPYQNPTPFNARIKSGETPAWRLSIKVAKEALGAKFDALTFINNENIEAATPAIFGDAVLARKDIGTSYHLACTFDDAAQGVTDVVRGRDLLESTHIHVLIQALMDWPTTRYHHHELLMASKDEKLSKRRGDTSIRALRKTGHSPADVLGLARAGAAG